jgi:secondary thiamine-phosphate synthase enzyme
VSLRRESIDVPTRGRGTYDLTREVDAVVRGAGIGEAMCNVFIAHTSASLIICENADPDVRTDLETFMSDLVRDGDPRFLHRAEGPDDMAAHLRSILTCSSLSIPVSGGRLALGTWQGLYLYEHRTAPHRRRVTVSVVG